MRKMTAEQRSAKIEADFRKAIQARPDLARTFEKAENLVRRHLADPKTGVIKGRLTADGKYQFSVQSRRDAAKDYEVSMKTRICKCYDSTELGHLCYHYWGIRYVVNNVLELDPARVW